MITKHELHLKIQDELESMKKWDAEIRRIRQIDPRTSVKTEQAAKDRHQKKKKYYESVFNINRFWYLF